MLYNNNGDDMKYLKVIIIAILVGIGLAFLFFKNIEKELMVFNESSNKIYVFQAGVFKIKENAYNYANNFNSNIVYYDNEYYRVYIAAISNQDNITLLENYFNKNNINYFIKEIHVKNINNDFYNYDKLLSETNKDVVIDKINQDMLDILITYLN